MTLRSSRPRGVPISPATRRPGVFIRPRSRERLLQAFERLVLELARQAFGLVGIAGEQRRAGEPAESLRIGRHQFFADPIPQRRQRAARDVIALLLTAGVVDQERLESAKEESLADCRRAAAARPTAGSYGATRSARADSRESRRRATGCARARSPVGLELPALAAGENPAIAQGAALRRPSVHHGFGTNVPL